jgi:APA family basic amino acid/polyamine antiporter
MVPAVVVLFSAALFSNTIYARPREAAIGMVLMLAGECRASDIFKIK